MKNMPELEVRCKSDLPRKGGVGRENLWAFEDSRGGWHIPDLLTGRTANFDTPPYEVYESIFNAAVYAADIKNNQGGICTKTRGEQIINRLRTLDQ